MSVGAWTGLDPVLPAPQPTVFMLTGAAPSTHTEELARLDALVASARVRDPSAATVAIAIGDPEQWAAVELPRTTPTWVWFDAPRGPEAYQAALRRLPAARFLHGTSGLAQLRGTLERIGLTEPEPELDEVAGNVLIELERDWLDALEAEFRELSVHTDPTSWRGWLVRVVATAPTWGFAGLAKAANELLDRGAPVDTGALAEAFVAVQSARFTHERRAPAPPVAYERGVRQRIIVLTDEERVARQARLALEHSQLKVIVHSDPATLADVVDAVMPDALVVAQRLRHFDGIDVVGAARENPTLAALPVLALLTEPGDAAVQHAMRNGVTSWITAPWSAETLVLATMNLLRTAEAIRKGGAVDPLTRLLTRDALEDALSAELVRGRQLGTPTSVTLLHLDVVAAGPNPRRALTGLAADARLAFGDSARIARFNERTLAVVTPGGPQVLADHLRQLGRERADQSPVRYAATLAPPGAAADVAMADVTARLERVLLDATAATVDWCAGPGARVRPPTVFLFDGDRTITNLVEYFCGREGYDVHTAGDGRSAMALLDEAERDGRLPNLVVMEAYLPGTDGFRVLENVKRRFGERVAVIMLTVQQSEERVARAFDLGAVDFVAKPFRVPELMARVKNALVRAGAVHAG